jgi:hypothetical protein
MPEPDLIDRYLTELRKSMSSRNDIEDVVAEVEDHLREATGRLNALDRPKSEAQRLTIERFGDSSLVAKAFAADSAGGIVMPSVITRTSGAVALVTAALWCLVATLNWWASGLSVPFTEDRWMVVMWVVFAALLGTVLVAVGMVIRMGRRDLVPLVAVAGVLGAVGFTATAWMWPIWGLFISAGFLLVLLRWRGSMGGVRLPDWAMVAAWPAGLGTVVGLSVLEAGPIDEYGDHPVAVVVGLAVVAALMTVGLVSVGSRLIGEKSARAPRAVVHA